MNIEDRLDALTTMSITELRASWSAALGSQPPKLGPDLLRRMLGHELQEKAMGGLSPSHRQALRRLAAGKEATPLKSGTRLVRQWNGRTIAVTVEEGAFIWEERSYRSLSAIAREVTGTSWSGPRFFGLNSDG
jgi:hypothetical protein